MLDSWFGGDKNHHYETKDPFARSRKRKKAKVVYASHGRTATPFYNHASTNDSRLMGKRCCQKRKGRITVHKRTCPFYFSVPMFQYADNFGLDFWVKWVFNLKAVAIICLCSRGLRFLSQNSYQSLEYCLSKHTSDSSSQRVWF